MIKPRARRRDPLTSWAAAFRAGKFADDHRSRIGNYLHRIHPDGATADEIAVGLSMEKAAVERRMVELQRTLIALPHRTETRTFRSMCNGRVFYAVKPGAIPDDLVVLPPDDFIPEYEPEDHYDD